MTKPGREFERLVELLEHCLVPEGAEVKSPDYIPDKTIGSLREVDVSIRMNVGSIPVLIILECRDRARVDDVTWIEQLAQKRNDLNAAKAVAVSSSGFSQPAQDKARFHGVETRHIDEITSDDIRDWFWAGEMILFLQRGHIHSVSVCLDSDSLDGEIQIDEDTAHRLSKCSVDDDLFICKKDGKKCSLKTVLGWMPKDVDIYRGVPQNGSKVRRTLDLSFPDTRERYQFPTKSGLIDISRIICVVDLWIEPSSVPIKNILSYKSPGTSLVQTVEYEIDIEGRKNIISFHKSSQSGQITVYRRVG
jgi:hypothetical protein